MALNVSPAVNARPSSRISGSDRDRGGAIEAGKPPDTPKPERQWLEDARTGDAEAFDRLARHYLPRIRRWALVRTGDPDDADEVVQRTLVQAFRGIGGFKAKSRLSTWLYRITVNAALELERGRKSRERGLESFRRRQEEEEPGAGDGLHALVARFLSDLSPNQRGMMDLVDLQGHEPAEAAAMLGLNSSTARVHLLRARRRVRAWILEKEPAVVEDLR